jgi:acyl-CoA synthetase (AMP-forming)/AMP-acid ligase II
MHSPFSVFEAKATARPQAPLLIAPASAGLAYAPQGFRMTYGEVLAAVLRLKAAFEAAGYGAGQRVALLLENRPEFFSHWLALNGLGVSIVPINPDLRPAELEYQLGIAEADLLVTYAKAAPAMEGLFMPHVRVITVGEAIPPRPQEHRASRAWLMTNAPSFSLPAAPASPRAAFSPIPTS